MNKKILIALLLSLSLFGCNKWLKVDSKDKIMEDKIFSTKDKFMSTLNGVYIELASSYLYGGNLSFGIMDVMGQYYNIHDNADHRFATFANYEWGSATTKNSMGNIWDKSYNLIANVNTILEKCDELGNNVLGDRLNKMVKGEALALRAMLHFDIFRIFGPIYSSETASQKTIPYVVTPDREIAPLGTAEEIMNKIVKDLTDAEALLAEDPVIEEGQTPGNYNGNATFAFRQYRLNLFAVKALRARAEQWRGNTQEAAKIAGDVIEATKELFAFTPAEQANHHLYPDRVFSTETLFGLYHVKRNDYIYKTYFIPDLSLNDILTLAGEYASGRLDKIYPDQNDYRYKMWAQETVNSTSVLYCRMFEDVVGSSSWATDSYRYNVPLITMGELYLIAAEGTADLELASKYISALRNARGTMSVTLTTDNKDDMIMEEFTREMLGKGQLFFKFKRMGLRVIPNGSKVDGTMEVELGIYNIPLPDSETSQRQDN